MTTIRRAVLLARVSTSDKGQDPETQLQALRAAAARLGWTIAAELQLKLSAWDERAAAEVRRRALEQIELGHADTLMVWSWDRFSRQGIDGAFRELAYLEQHLGAAFYSLQEPFLCTASESREHRELLLAVISWAAKWESERRSERLRAKVVAKRGRAEQLGQRARWGKGYLALSQDATACLELRARGLSERSIAAALGLSKTTVHRHLRSTVTRGPAADLDGAGVP